MIYLAIAVAVILSVIIVATYQSYHNAPECKKPAHAQRRAYRPYDAGDGDLD